MEGMDSTRTLIECRPVGGVPLKRNDTTRVILVGNNVVSFTRMEYSLVLLLLGESMVEDKVLTAALFGNDEPDKPLLKNLEKHVENTKSKLKPTGLYIRRIHRYGYSLVR